MPRLAARLERLAERSVPSPGPSPGSQPRHRHRQSEVGLKLVETIIWVKRCNFSTGHTILIQSLSSLYVFLTNKFGNQSVSGKFL